MGREASLGTALGCTKPPVQSRPRVMNGNAFLGTKGANGKDRYFGPVALEPSQRLLAPTASPTQIQQLRDAILPPR